MHFDNIVFAGGGNRCFWQAGFWETLSRELPLAPKTIASVSAGSAISSALFAGKIQETLEITKEVMSKNAKNRYLKNLIGPDSVYPHAKLYRQIILRALDSEAFLRMKNGPENRILLAHIPRWLGPRSAVLLGLGAYQLEKHMTHPVHPVLGRKLGFRSEFVPASSCQSIESLADVILGSSCTPPFTPMMHHNGKPILDGGMVDNVPVHGISDDSGKTLVLLTRPYKSLPSHSNREYVQPSRKVDVQSWDYTSPEKVQLTFELGRSDAIRYLQQRSKRYI